MRLSALHCKNSTGIILNQSTFIVQYTQQRGKLSLCSVENIQVSVQGTPGGERLWHNTKVWSSYCFLALCACLSVLSQQQQKGYKKNPYLFTVLCAPLLLLSKCSGLFWYLSAASKLSKVINPLSLCVCVCCSMYSTLASAKSKFSYWKGESLGRILIPVDTLLLWNDFWNDFIFILPGKCIVLLQTDSQIPEWIVELGLF